MVRAQALDFSTGFLGLGCSYVYPTYELLQFPVLQALDECGFVAVQLRAYVVQYIPSLLIILLEVI
jgi:hypothetical protein